MSCGFAMYILDLRYAQRKYSHTEKPGECASYGMSLPLEITDARCAAVHCSSVTKTASVKAVRDEPASVLTGNGTNCALKLVRFP